MKPVSWHQRMAELTPTHSRPISTHTALESVYSNIIEPDDLLRVLGQAYSPGQEPPSCRELEQYLRDLIEEFGNLDPEWCDWIDFELCGSCSHLILWDDKLETYRHVEPGDCTWQNESGDS